MAIKFGEQEFHVPDEVTYRQYYHISKLLDGIDVNKFRKEAPIKIDDTDKVKKDKKAILLEDEENIDYMGGLDFNAIKNALFDNHKIPKFFATLLVPTGSMWKPEMLEKNEELFMDIGDKTATEVLQSFLSGRGNLMESILDFFTGFLQKKSESMENSKPLTKPKESK